MTCNETPILARILAVADTFDAMATNRIYKPRKSVETSFKELESLSGTLFDPVVVEQAIKVLRDISIAQNTTQLPTSVIEQERLSHYFKDPLTKLFNRRCLQLTMQYGIEGSFWICANIVAIRKFSELNQNRGWEAGNQVLIQLAELLECAYERSLIFRFCGDDFVMLSEEHLSIDFGQLETKSITLTGIQLYFSLMHFDLYNLKERQSLKHKLESAIG